MSEVTALNCPNCGGSVDIPAEHAELIKCPYCGTTLQLPHPPEDSPRAEFERAAEIQEKMQEALVQTHTSAKPARGPSIFSVILTVIILAAIGIGVAAVFVPVFSSPTYLYDGVVPLLPAENGTPDLAVVVRQGDEDNIRLAVMDGKTHATRWVSSESFSTSDGHLAPIPGGERIYFLDGNNLMAYQAATGKIAWQKTLTNGVSTSCTGCVSLVGGKLVLLTKEGGLQALDPATGEAAWSVALNTSPTELLLAGGKPAVVDRDSSKNNVFQIYDPQTGKVAQQFDSGCKPAGSKNAQGLEEVYLSPDGSLAYLMYFNMGSDRPPCAQQVDLASGKVTWTAIPAGGQTWPSAWFASEVLVSDQGVFFYEDNSLSVIDAKTGELRPLFKEPRYRQVTPLVSQPGLVVALAIPDYDSESKELWGIDSATGKKLWTFKMQAKSIIDPYQVKLIAAGLVVVQCLGDAKSSQWQVLDPLTGASQGMKQLSNENYNFLEDAWTPTTAYLKIDNLLYVVDVKTGAVEYTWP
jgi:outer membrane protein assembly factor BamB/rRNA maturation protein Nop10